jgi:hypothetical protein
MSGFYQIPLQPQPQPPPSMTFVVLAPYYPVHHGYHSVHHVQQMQHMPQYQEYQPKKCGIEGCRIVSTPGKIRCDRCRQNKHKIGKTVITPDRIFHRMCLVDGCGNQPSHGKKRCATCRLGNRLV